MALSISIGSDNLLRLTDLVDQSGGDEATPATVTTATVTAIILDPAGTNISGTISMPYVTGTDSDYEGIIPDTLTLVEGTFYTVEVTADDGPGRTRKFTRTVQAYNG